MKVYITVDIEGITGINNWPECDYTKPEYQYFRNRMNLEAISACEGALAGGATEIVVRDAHGASKNLDADRLPKQATLIRGWSGHPYAMVQGIDRTFAACMMVGYHSRAGSSGNPLAHTMSGASTELRLNGRPFSEFSMHALTSELEGVPTVMVAGDAALCEDVPGWNENITTVATTQHCGTTTQTLAHPDLICERITAAAASSLANRDKCHLQMPKEFSLEIDFKEPAKAYKFSWYPGVELTGDRSVRFRTTNYFEVIRAINFMY